MWAQLVLQICCGFCCCCSWFNCWCCCSCCSRCCCSCCCGVGNIKIQLTFRWNFKLVARETSVCSRICVCVCSQLEYTQWLFLSFSFSLSHSHLHYLCVCVCVSVASASSDNFSCVVSHFPHATCLCCCVGRVVYHIAQTFASAFPLHWILWINLAEASILHRIHRKKLFTYLCGRCRCNCHFELANEAI